MAKIKKDENFLDYIPVRNPEFEWKIKENGFAEVSVINKGFFNKIAQTVFRRPRVSHIELDAYGTFLWENVDGESDILALSEKMKAHFGEKAEPVLERLVKFIKILQTNQFISYKNKV
ncbi:MAG: PqqD family protein [Hespellia sp.]|nr:PqqD family protein [Hespellia sp.]